MFADGGPFGRFITVPTFTLSDGLLLAVVADPGHGVEARPRRPGPAGHVLHPACMAMLTYAMSTAPRVAITEESRGGAISVPLMVERRSG